MVRKDILLMCVEERMKIRMSRLRIWLTFVSAKIKVIKHMNVKPEPCMHQDLKYIGTIVRNIDIEPLNADPNPCGHQTSQQR